jgi:hypothetical protein
MYIVVSTVSAMKCIETWDWPCYQSQSLTEATAYCNTICAAAPEGKKIRHEWTGSSFPRPALAHPTIIYSGDNANPTYLNHFRLDERNCFGKSFLRSLKKIEQSVSPVSANRIQPDCCRAQDVRPIHFVLRNSIVNATLVSSIQNRSCPYTNMYVTLMISPQTKTDKFYSRPFGHASCEMQMLYKNTQENQILNQESRT